MGLPLLESVVAHTEKKREVLALLQKTLEENDLSQQWALVPLCVEKTMQNATQDLRRELHNVASALTSISLIVRVIEEKLSKNDPADLARLEQIKQHAEVINQLKRGFVDPLFRQLLQQVEQT